MRLSERFKRYIFSTEVPLEERRFMLVAAVALVSIIGVSLSVVSAMKETKLLFWLAIGFVLVLGSAIYARRTRNYTLGGVIIMIIANVLVIPAGYLLGGGLDSGAPIWPSIGLIMVFVLFRGPLFWIFFVMSVASMGGVMYAAYLHPEWVVPLGEHYSEHLDVFVGYFSVGVLVGALFLLQSRVLEREIDRAHAQTIEIEKLNDVQSNFFATMSHEIRTPINTIIGLNEMTMRERNLPDDIQENTINIQNASKMLLSLINDLLDMSKIQTDNMVITETDYDTSRMLSEITNLHWNKAMEKGLHFDVQVDDSIPQMLHGDENRIKQVIINLISNGIKYTDEGYVVVRFGGEKAENGKFMLQVEVEDSGMGIRKENMQYLFDAFRRVEEGETKNIEGTGLGLAIAKKLVELMGGTISVDSIYTKGSTFRIEIPQGMVKGYRSGARTPGVIKSNAKDYQQTFEAPEAWVLIVDDNDMNRMVCQKLLRATKVNIDVAESGRECLEYTKEKHYDAILMDHEMPQMDGLEALRRVRQQPEGLNKDTPVVALTANAGSDKEAFYLENGFSAYLAKPIQTKQLESMLMACLPSELIEQKFVNEAEEELTITATVHKIPYLITTDSICDLPTYVLEENEIRIMPYYIVTRRGRFRDVSEIDADNLMHFINNTEYEAHSDPSPVEEYEEFFGEALTEAKCVIHLSSSKETSAAYNNALKASESFGNVVVIDSGQITSGLGMVALHAAELTRSGKSLEEIIEDINAYKTRVSLNFLIPSLNSSGTKYHMPRILRLAMDVFNLEPIFIWKKGRAKIKKFLMGYLRNTADQFVHDTLSKKNKIKTTKAYVVFSCCSPELREHVLNEIENVMDFDELIVNKSSAATFINIGPSAFGITFEKEV